MLNEITGKKLNNYKSVLGKSQSLRNTDEFTSGKKMASTETANTKPGK